MSQRKTLGSLLVRLGMTDREADKAIKDFERKLKRLERNVSATGRAMTVGFTAPFILGIAKSIKAYDEEIQVVKKLEVALGFTSQALLKQAAAIQKTTVYADDQIITIQAWAASLGHSETEIQKMTTAAVGLAAGLGIGLEEAMQMLHKTTLGVAGGLGKLVPGVKELTKEQLRAGEAIALVDSKFKGYAETAAKTGLGPLKILQNQLGDMMEDIGRIAIPFVTSLAEKLKNLAEWFDELSPSMKESLIHFGGLVAIAGPVLLLAGNVLKLAAAFKELGGSMAFLSNPYTAAALLALGAGTGIDSLIYKDSNGNRKIKTDSGGRQYTQSFGSEVALGKEGRQYLPTFSNSSLFGQNPDLIPGYGMTFPKSTDMATGLDQSGWDAPIKVGAQKVGQTLVAASDWMYKSMVSTPRPALDPMEVIAGFSAGRTNYSPEDGPDNVPLMPDNMMPQDYRVPEELSTEGMSTQLDKVEALNQGYVDLGNTIASVMTDMANSLSQGVNAFAAFGLAALKAAAQVAKAALAESLANAVKKGAAVAGAPGIIIGAIAGMAAIGIVEGMINRIKAPKLAKGGLAFGPTMAVVGDNPNAHVDPEVISPLSKLKGMMGGAMGQRVDVNVTGQIAGDVIRLSAARSQNQAFRRGSANLIRSSNLITY